MSVEMAVLAAFGISAAASLVSKRLGYFGVMLSSIMLAAFGVLNAADGVLSFFYVISAIVLALTSWYSLGYDVHHGWLAPLFCAAAFGISAILVSQNFMVFLAGWEVMSVAGYVMIGLNKMDWRPAFAFMAFGEVSTVFIIAGMAYAYATTGSVAFAALRSVVPLALVSVGFFIKMGIMPFSISDWLPIAHRSAPASGSAVLSALMTLMGVFGILKFALLSPASLYLGVVLMAIGAFTVLFAALYEYVSESTKLMLGYSTIENNGAILVGLGLLVASPQSLPANLVIYAIIALCLGHSVAKTGLFLASGSLGSEDMDYRGNKKDSVALFGEIMAAASLSGLLPTIGGLGVWMLLESLFLTASNSGVLLGVITIVVGATLALGEGMASSGMVKFLSFTQLFSASGGKRPVNMLPVLAAGALVVLLGVCSVFFVSPRLVTGNIPVGIPNGFLIASSTSAGATFGVVSPFFVMLVAGAFVVLALITFGYPRTRHAMAWNNGLRADQHYTSFAFANNIRLMVGRILATKVDAPSRDTATRNIFWDSMIGAWHAYRGAAEKFAWNLMNSSLGSYVAYIVIAFVLVVIALAFQAT